MFYIYGAAYSNQKHTVEWGNPETKEYILYESIHIKFNQAKFTFGVKVSYGYFWGREE